MMMTIYMILIINNTNLLAVGEGAWLNFGHWTILKLVQLPGHLLLPRVCQGTYPCHGTLANGDSTITMMMRK